jgi:hypothetical protein
MTKSDELFSKTELGENTFSSFSERIKNNLLIYNKTIPEWWAYFGIRLEEDNLNPEICKQLGRKVANLYQEASYYYSLASSSSNALESSQSSTHTERYASVVASYRENNEKVPAAATIEQLVKAEQDEVYSAIATAKIAKDFFKTVLDSLNTVRKIIDTATINSGIEAKLTSANSYREGDD